MSVLIRGMEMPKSCYVCRFCDGTAETEIGVCAYCCVDGGYREAYASNDCPLVPVPPYLDYPKERKPQTNADRIRGMTDEELTRFFAENCGCDDWCMHKRSGACASKSENECCLDVWLDWLKSPVEE